MTDESHGLSKWNEDEEKAFVNAFISKNRRDRYIQLLSSPKRRKDILNDLCHTIDLFPGTYSAISGSADETINTAMRLLEDKGAKKDCYVISPEADIDQHILPLREMVIRLIRYDSVAILCCVPGQLAFYKEEISGCYLLEHTK